MHHNPFYNQKNIFLVALFFLLQISLFSQSITLKGQIEDADSQDAIPYATVQNLTDDSGVFADDFGIFKLPIKEFPTQLVISSVGYKSDTLLIKKPTPNLTIFLKKNNNLLPKVEVLARQKLKAINDKTYFPHNFVMWNDYVFLLSKKGTFGNFQIEVFDEQGNLFKTHQLDLGRIDDIKVNCLDKLYIGNKTHNINLDYASGQFIPLSQISNSDYDTLFEDCICQDESSLIYEIKLYNGLVKKYVNANKKTGESALFKEIKEEQRLENYKEDIALINKAHAASNMGDIDVCENERIRSVQLQGDFMEQIFYKNFAINYLFSLDEQFVLFNHEERKIEFFGEKEYFIPMEFADNKAYMGLILLDKTTKKLHAAFNVPKGVVLKEVSLITGQTEKEHFLEVAHFEKMEVQNDVAFVLGIHENARMDATKSFFIKKLE